MNKTYDDYGDLCSEIRVIPLPGDGNILAGIRGFHREMQWRKLRNLELSPEARYPILQWEQCRVYFPVEE